MLTVQDKMEILNKIFDESKGYTFKPLTKSYSVIEVTCPKCKGIFNKLFKNLNRSKGYQIKCSNCNYYNRYERIESKQCSYCLKKIPHEKKWKKNKYCNLECMGKDNKRKSIEKYLKNPEKYKQMTGGH